MNLHHIQKHQSIFLALVLFISLIFVPITSAQTFTINVTGVSGDCSVSLSVEALTPTDVTVLLSGSFGIVLYGGDNAAFAYANLPVSTSISLGLNYVELGDPAPGTVTGRIYAISGTGNSVGEIESGFLIATATLSFNDLEACTGIAVSELSEDTSVDVTVTVDGEEVEPVAVFSDGRLNDFDSGSPIAIFPFTVEDEIGLQIYDTHGNLVLYVSPEAIAAVEECPEVNTLILENEELEISIWRLSSCEYQIMAPTGEPGKFYIIILDTLFENGFYISFEQFME